MIKQQWDKLNEKINSISVRERVLIFAAAAFLVVSLVNAFLLDPQLAKQKRMTEQVVQQQEKIKEIQSQVEGIIQAKNAQSTSPLHLQLNKVKEEIAEGNLFLKSNRENLVEPDKMADLLRQVLSKNLNLQLVNLQTLPVTPLFEMGNETATTATAVQNTEKAESQIYKHSVELTVKGNYLDLLQYLSALERMPTQMFWAKVKMNVVKYPDAELTLNLYTLSLDKVWLQI
jgi:MSHA biogenesis protein MshJ